MAQGHALLKFYDYGAALPHVPVMDLLEGALTDIVHGGHHPGRIIDHEVIYTRELDAGAGTLWLSMEPEAEMTWGMFETAVTGVVRFVRRWDDVEFAVDVEMMDAGRKAGTAFLSRF
ncbi:MAG: hypothetical protein ALECFALPRED_001134 [Alectoria fallacina]|uniref:Uncharacterized protein n=1 Tax=Alectoria fallacina TaxID=1903189 RepID=A0A8H3IL36_9LECA|nr:MAG: hypothetical protein ALECFALPRED_001134 [Alectoria fallacina]